MSKIYGLHRHDGDAREENDFYATHPTSIPPLLKLLGMERGGAIIRENSCGQGHLSKELERYGHTVISSDLIDRGYGITGINFLEKSWLDDLRYDLTIMNPPYKHALEFVKKSLTQTPTVCAFLRLTWLESENRREFFINNPPHTIGVFSKRMPSAKHGDFERIGNGGTVAYAWFIWSRGYKGDPVIKWI